MNECSNLHADGHQGHASYELQLYFPLTTQLDISFISVWKTAFSVILLGRNEACLELETWDKKKQVFLFPLAYIPTIPVCRLRKNGNYLFLSLLSKPLWTEDISVAIKLAPNSKCYAMPSTSN